MSDEVPISDPEIHISEEGDLPVTGHPQKKPGRLRPILKRIVTFPLVRIVLALLFVVGLSSLFIGIVMVTVTSLKPEIPFTQDSAALPALLFIHFFYWLYVRIFEKRAVSEISFRGIAGELGNGLALGFWLFTLIIACLNLFGLFRITGMNEWTTLLTMVLTYIAYGYHEEIMFRAIVFRMLEEWRGTYSAVVFSSLLFGLIHMGNTNATLFSSLAISIEAGLLLAAAYVLTRRLWLATGIHIAWNYTQGSIFGASTSGLKVEGFFISEASGPAILSGGRFGPEASLFAIVIGGLVGAALLKIAVQQRKIVHLKDIKSK